MGAMRLTSENVRYAKEQVLKDVDYWAHEGKEAEKTLAYLCGVDDMANAVIRAIKELGGN